MLLFLTYVPRKSTFLRTLGATIIFRVFLLLELSSMYITINMPVSLIFLLHYRWRWWLIIHAALYGSAVLQGLFSNYVIMRKRPDLRVEWYILIIAPLYRFILRWFRLVAIVVSALVYVPLYPLPSKVDERIEVQAVVKTYKITGQRIQPTLPKEMDKYTEMELRLKAEADSTCDLPTHEPPLFSASVLALAKGSPSAVSNRQLGLALDSTSAKSGMDLDYCFDMAGSLPELTKQPPSFQEFEQPTIASGGESSDGEVSNSSEEDEVPPPPPEEEEEEVAAAAPPPPPAEEEEEGEEESESQCPEERSPSTSTSPAIVRR
jgi:hypothetical protein